jgi:hypothetical protein
MMDVKTLQAALGVAADGQFGPMSKAALFAALTNPRAPAITPEEVVGYATVLGCTAKQLGAVASVESSGSGFDGVGRPKILFERHLFHRLTDGKWTPAPFSELISGGYDESSWDKLAAACAKDPDAAFSSCSWGKFQVLGAHWSKLHYDSPFSLAKSCVRGEAPQYELLVRFIETFGLADDLRALSADPEACRAFAKAYNGANYAANGAYHEKLARAMR